MARHKVEIIGVNTANIKVLSNEEMISLFKEMHNGDVYAKDELINGNLKLVLSILKKYQNRCDNMDDLFQIGCIGLIKAIDNFDLSHEVKFSTYAVPMIIGEIKRYLRDNNSLRVSRSVKDLALKIIRKKEEMLTIKGREPTMSELAKELEITEYELANALDSMKDVMSMFEPIYNDGSDTIYLCDQLEDKHNKLYDLETKISLKDALKKIKEKEKYILLERFIYGKTQVELASELGISQAQISRLEKSGIENIKKMIEN
ncbi:MAG: SigB/SigF/SigG family RNA polymerase sigma factor [Bacilli bacterium]|nr:SigB/SigF/SigG family RNA polymerase sigma factor [Bacilli bacterium]